MQEGNYFRDAENRKFCISFTYGDVKRVKELLGVNILDFTGEVPEGKDAGSVDIDKLPVQMRLQMDPILLVDVIYCLVKPQADAAGITDIQFGESLGPEEFHAAKEIFWRAYHDFFLKSGDEQRAKIVGGMIKVSGQIARAMEDVDLDVFLDGKLEEAKRAIADIAAT